ncbi:cytochrome bd-I oxidase subunit CydX [Litoreibacter janthinus]|uniref:Cyd operon protein YbgT n=1 Tax=Litoreibacter janthinus TaxID=670154 RepID=A0A1I6HHD7_9RHOB|nr:cytochrome bd-I oxidase subunit CydX [Litoreibacter janthinus]SFR53720.1 cyd operon protein YbgT [Litoreibacter janthinus]
MWYFAWLLGLPLAAIFAVMNAMWLELKEDERVIASGAQDPRA